MKKLFNWLCIAILSVSTGQLNAAESDSQPQDPVVAEVFGMQIRTKNPDEMQDIILQKLFQNYAKQNKIAASQKDIDLYIANVEHFMVADRKKNDARRIEIQQQLRAESLPAEQTKRLQSELATLESLHQYDLQEDREKEQDPEAMHRDMQPAAKAIIEHWMINKALYQQYGGRIIAQQLGPEPLDAMHDYLLEQQKKGAFKIVKQSFEAPFWVVPANQCSLFKINDLPEWVPKTKVATLMPLE